MDSVDRATRSRIMRAVPRQDSVPELKLRKALHRLGLRYRLHVKSLPGTPDIVFPRAHLAVFVHGCFWHRHVGCLLATTPGTNVSFWLDKFRANVARDERVTEQLIAAGWRTEIAWQCEIDQDPILVALRIAELKNFVPPKILSLRRLA